MTRAAILATLLLLAACNTAPPDPLTDREQCERQVDKDPRVQELMQKQLGNPTVGAENAPLLRDARIDAVKTCLRNRGVFVPGGVERPKRLEY